MERKLNIEKKGRDIHTGIDTEKELGSQVVRLVASGKGRHI